MLHQEKSGNPVCEYVCTYKLQTQVPDNVSIRIAIMNANNEADGKKIIIRTYQSFELGDQIGRIFAYWVNVYFR
jgi:hypothetical protein